MEWWQAVVSVSSVSIVGVLSWGLKQIVEIKGIVSSLEVWVKGTDQRIAVHEEKHRRADERFGWGASKINGLLHGYKELVRRVRKLEEVQK